MRYLAIDLGDARTGLALGDGQTRLVTALPPVEVSIHLQQGNVLVEALARVVEDQLGRVPRPAQARGGPPTLSQIAALFPGPPPEKPPPLPASLAGELVFGLPLNMDGSEGPRTRIVRAIAERLGARVGRNVRYQDERLTTDAADWSMARSGMTRGEKKTRRDSRAAAIFLADFLAAGAATEAPRPPSRAGP